MQYKKILNYQNEILLKNLAWIFFGFILFMPIEVLVDGLYLSYFQIVILFLCCGYTSNLNITLLFIYLFFVTLSIMSGFSVELTSLVNPFLTGIALVTSIKDINKIKMVNIGLYLSAIINGVYLCFLAYKNNLNNIFTLLSSRVWAVEQVPYFGNGLAMLFAATMLLAFIERKYFILSIAFIGGVLTTSRIPQLFFLVIIGSFMLRNLISKPFNTFVLMGFATLFFISLSSLNFFDLSPGQIDLLKSRFSEADDRFEVYQLTLTEIINNPFLGVGSTKLYYYEHSHNSYIQVLYKYGLFALFVWLFLLYLVFFKNLKWLNNIEFIIFFLIISVSQIGLQNPNLLLVILMIRQTIRYDFKKFNSNSLI